MSRKNPATIPTRILIMSDTHLMDLGNPDHCRAFSLPVPPVDVLLHCGDFTQYGSIEGYKLALNMLGRIPAELKLVIAGNHDLSLDNDWWQTKVAEHQDEQGHVRGVRVMKGPLAQVASVTYLEEGTHSFNLRNGARFTVCASPYTPEHEDRAFQYRREEDRYNPPSQVCTEAISIARKPIPDFPQVDIVMTHGPPRGVLDRCKAGNVGCSHLLRAVQRARPRLHCFGHIHEGHGALVASWQPRHRRGEITKEVLREPVFDKKLQLPDTYPTPVDCNIEFGHETLMVNGCITNGHGKLRNRPWIFDLDLPSRAEWRSRRMPKNKHKGFPCCCASATVV